MPENHDFYSRYGQPVDEHNSTIYIYCRRPGSIYDLDTLAHEDTRAADKIKELEAYIRQLKQHRQAIAERYQELATSPTVPVVRLERTHGYSGIKYYLRQFRQYLDGSRTETSCETYSGKQRHEAIAAYKALVKAHPGIIAEMDIEKQRWER